MHHPERDEHSDTKNESLSSFDTPGIDFQRAEVRYQFKEALLDPGLSALAERIFGLLRVTLSRPDWRAASWMVMSFLMLNLQACSVMHRAQFDEENGFHESSRDIDDEEEVERRREMLFLLENPMGCSNLALLTGINDEQKGVIMDDFEDLFEEVERADFDEYMQVCREAKEKLGIMCFNRYPPALIREVVRNFNEPEYNSEKPAVIVIIDRDDHTKFGIYPLSVESYQVAKLPEYYKVFLFECASVPEILFQINRLINEERLRRGALASLVVGSHGTETHSSTGMQLENIPMMSRFMEYAHPDNMTIVLANCYSGEGHEEGDNIVNRFALSAGRNYRGSLRVIGADTFLAGVELDTRPNGQVRTLDFQSLLGRLSGGIFNITYTAERDAVFPPYYHRLRDDCSRDVPNGFLNSAIGYGICDARFIEKMYREGVSPDHYMEYISELARLNVSISQDLILQSLKQRLSPFVVQQCVAARHYRNTNTLSLHDLQFFELGITPDLIASYKQVMPELLHSQIISLKGQNILPEDLSSLKGAGLQFTIPELLEVSSTFGCRPDRFIRFSLMGVREIGQIRGLLSSGMNEMTIATHHATGINIFQVAADRAGR